MRLVLASVGARRSKVEAGLVEDYLARAGVYAPCGWESFPDEARLLAGVERMAGRTAAVLLLFDSRGRGLTSEEFAGAIGGWRDGGRQTVVLGVGPASGWTEAARGRAEMQVSLGRMTLPHALAQVVVAEQMYRALTILAGHPYHGGHLG